MYKIISKENALYQGLAIDPTGKKLVFNKTNAQKFKDAIEPSYDDAEDELAWIDLTSGNEKLIDKANGRYNPHFALNDDRIYLNNRGRLISIQWDGGDEKEIAKSRKYTTQLLLQKGINEVQKYVSSAEVLDFSLNNDIFGETA